MTRHDEAHAMNPATALSEELMTNPLYAVDLPTDRTETSPIYDALVAGGITTDDVTIAPGTDPIEYARNTGADIGHRFDDDGAEPPTWNTQPLVVDDAA